MKMEPPAPPRDPGLRNIIDKLAEFVARNGPDFEQITKAKQKGNPKFEFLYGGEHYNYYQYRVATEQALLNQQTSVPQTQQISGQNYPQISHGQHQQQPPWTNGSNANPVSDKATTLTQQIEAINMQQNTLREQIRQSEQNLSAQHGVLIQQQQKQIDDAITRAENDSIQKLAEENNIRLSEFDAILQPIIESCTKDSISTGKNWILQHTSDTAKCNVVLQYLLKKALVNGSTFLQKLHLIYLVNDILHHCVRKNANDLKSNLENVVIPMFCSAEMIANTEQKAKLTKLLSLWESKAKFFDACVISKLRSPESSIQEYKTNLMNKHISVVTQITQTTKSALDSYQQQHQIFIQHATQQITVLESQKQALEQQIFSSNVLPDTNLIAPLIDAAQLQNNLNPTITANNMSTVVTSTNVVGNHQINNNLQIQQPQQQQQQPKGPPPPLMSQKITLPPDVSYSPQLMINQQNDRTTQYPINNQFHSFHQQSQPQPQAQPQQQQSQPQTQPQQQQQQQQQANQLPQIPPPAYNGQTILPPITHGSEYTAPPPSFTIPDLSKPPPGFTTNTTQPPAAQPTVPPVIDEDVKPTVPYYELPAGLMVPLIRLEDYRYKPLDPNDIRLPPPTPQSERLASAIVAFYSQPSHATPRDVDGWEKLGLYEYYKVKNAARKQKEEEIQSGTREKSRSPTPILLEQPKPKKIKKRCYRSKSRSRSRSKSPQRPKSRSRSHSSRSRSKSRSRSRSPPIRLRYSSTKRSRSRSRSPKKNQRGRSPIRSERERDFERDIRPRERDRDRNERERSITPPSFFGAKYAKSNELIEESNKGHQMLMKMGWSGSGSGLGANNQGVDSPVAAGEVRDRKDMYKGVGLNINDPFENFRKNKGAAFIHRMRTRGGEEKN